MGELPDDLITEILARVPYRWLCRFKCVSQQWLALCSDPGFRLKCPNKTVSGFFVSGMDGPSRCNIRRFVNVSGIGPPMVDPYPSFLPSSHRDFTFIQCCNGLILCERYSMRWRDPSRYFVCNPATEKWIELPYTQRMNALLTYICLGFDPAASSQFRVFLFTHTADMDISGVDIYSSDTGGWVYRQREKGGCAKPCGRPPAFFNNTLHWTTLYSSLVHTVDTDGKTWRQIPTPHVFAFVGFSQGHMHGVHLSNQHYRLSIWVLEDYAGQQWVLKHTVTAVELFRRPYYGMFSHMVPIHLEHSLIFYTTWYPTKSLVAYDTENKNVHTIMLLENYWLIDRYIPCFTEW